MKFDESGAILLPLLSVRLLPPCSRVAKPLPEAGRPVPARRAASAGAGGGGGAVVGDLYDLSEPVACWRIGRPAGEVPCID
jgi:hypothetical protein